MYASVVGSSDGSVRVPQRPSSALVGGAGGSASRTVGSILAERPATGYVRRSRPAGSAGLTRAGLMHPSQTKAQSDLRAAAPTSSSSRSTRPRKHSAWHDEDVSQVRYGLGPLSAWQAPHGRGDTAHNSPYSDVSRSIPSSRREPRSHTQQQHNQTLHGASHSVDSCRRQAPLSLHHSLFAGILIHNSTNTLLQRILRETEDPFLDAVRIMAARLGLRVLREVDLLFLLLSVFHGEAVDEGESRYLFKYLDYRNQNVVQLREVLQGLSTLYRPYDVTAALCCKRLASGQLPAESLVTVDELNRMIDGVATVLREHPLVDPAELERVKQRLGERFDAVQLDYCVPAATAHQLVKREPPLTQALAFLEWNGKIVMPVNKESELERLLRDGVRLQGAPAANRRHAQMLHARSDENRKILGYIHEIYSDTFLTSSVREESAERPIDATHPRFVADKYINRSRVAPYAV